MDVAAAGQTHEVISAASVIMGIVGAVAGAVGAWLGSRIKLNILESQVQELEDMVKTLPERFVELASCRQCKELTQQTATTLKDAGLTSERHLKENLDRIQAKLDRMATRMDAIAERQIAVLTEVLGPHKVSQWVPPGDGKD